MRSLQLNLFFVLVAMPILGIAESDDVVRLPAFVVESTAPTKWYHANSIRVAYFRRTFQPATSVAVEEATPEQVMRGLGRWMLSAAKERPQLAPSLHALREGRAWRRES